MRTADLTAADEVPDMEVGLFLVFPDPVGGVASAFLGAVAADRPGDTTTLGGVEPSSAFRAFIGADIILGAHDDTHVVSASRRFRSALTTAQ
jgi:hypothetical protein